MEQELEKEVEVASSPLQEKLQRLKEMIAKRDKEQIEREKNNNDLRYIFYEFEPHFQAAVEKNLKDLISEFTKVEFGRRINTMSAPSLTSIDFEARLELEEIRRQGFYLRMEGFKKGGTNAFNIYKDLFIETHRFKYALCKEQGKPWVEKLYHQKWTANEIELLAEQWCEEIVEEIISRFYDLK